MYIMYYSFVQTIMRMWDNCTLETEQVSRSAQCPLPLGVSFPCVIPHTSLLPTPPPLHTRIPGMWSMVCINAWEDSILFTIPLQVWLQGVCVWQCSALRVWLLKSYPLHFAVLVCVCDVRNMSQVHMNSLYLFL